MMILGMNTCLGAFLLLTRLGTGLADHHYTPDWNSLDSRPLPTWYDQVKIGIFMHFGPYSVPGIRSEWFWRDWANGDQDVVDFMKENYPPNFSYQDFGSQLTMELFDPSRWADVVLKSGAKYLVFTSKHHDGYANFNSSYSFGWNSMSVGANRNVLKELKDAFHAQDPDFHFGLYYSLFEWFNPLYLKDKSGDFASRDFVQNKIIPEMKELALNIEPHVWWSDGDWEATPDYWGSTDFLAWLFNDSPAKDLVVTNDRWGRGVAQKHGSFYSGPDRWQPGHLIEHKWENALTIDKKSWGIRRDLSLSDVMTMSELLSQVIISVSCGGNILINVGPTKEGTILPIFEERLTQLGDWLSVNGEAIYNTNPWVYQNDSFSMDPPVWYTAGTVDQSVYAILLGWPANQAAVLTLESVESTKDSKFEMLGMAGRHSLRFRQEGPSLKIWMPSYFELVKSCPTCQYASVIKMLNVKSFSNDVKVELQ